MAKQTKLPTWNLKDLYSGVKDPQLEKSLKSCLKRGQAFQKKYKGKLEQVVKKPAALRSAIVTYEKLCQDLAKPYIFASLRFAETATDPKRGAFLQKMRTQYVQVHKSVIFFELELIALPVKLQNSLAKSKELIHYRYYLENLFKTKRHRLSELEEALCAEKDTTGRAAFIRLFNEEFAERVFDFKEGKKLKSLSQTEMLQYLYHPDRKLRKAAAAGFSKGLKEDARRLTYIFNVLGQDKSIMDKHRSYNSPESARHLANQIDQKVVDTMTRVITDNYSLVQQVYRLKRKKMKLKELYDYDRYAPVTRSEKKVSFSDAKIIVLDAFNRFSPKMAQMAKQFFDRRWIDADKRPGKRGGAFCSFVTPDLHPYVFMNYDGSLRDVFTLAHELGHAIHAACMNKTSYVYFEVPLTVAETASVFAEMLVFEYVSSNTNKKDLFPLYLHKVENIFATVFRQTSMYLFEKDFHSALSQQGELQTEQINKIWRARQKEMFGSSVKLSSDYDYWWSYIPHFVHTPFYVYAYAFGELLTMALYARYKEQGQKFVDPYFNLLAAGGSQSPDALFKPLGVNLRSEAFWQGGISLIAELVNKLQRYSKY